MRFRFGGDQLAFRDAVRDLLERERDPWPKLLGLGIAGLDMVDLVLPPRPPDVGGRAAVGQRLADRGGELRPVFPELEPHRPTRGNPRTRSAAMLRWISLVPA